MQTGMAASSMNSTMASAIETFSLSKPTMKPAVTNMPGAVDLVDALGDVAPRVLLLLHRDQRRRVRTFDADEDGEEIGRGHHLQQLGIVGEIDRGLGRELERIVVRALPGDELGKKQPECLLVADEVVVDEVDMAAIADSVERVELGEHLRGRLGPRHPAVKLDDVAELAGERAAARELHAEIEIVFELEQVEARHRRLGDVDLEFRRCEDARRGRRPPRPQRTRR